MRDDKFMLRPSPLGKQDEAPIAPLYDKLLKGAAKANEAFAHSGRYMIDELRFDLSSDAAVQPLLGASGAGLQFSSDLADAEVHLDYILPTSPWVRHESLSFVVEGNRLLLNEFPETAQPSPWLRRILAVTARFADGRRLQRATLA